MQVLHPRDRHKITYCTQICTQCPIHHTHFLCRVYSCGLYSRAAYVQDSQPKKEAFIQDRLIFKGGFYTRLYGIIIVKHYVFKHVRAVSRLDLWFVRISDVFDIMCSVVPCTYFIGISPAKCVRSTLDESPTLSWACNCVSVYTCVTVCCTVSVVCHTQLILRTWRSCRLVQMLPLWAWCVRVQSSHTAWSVHVQSSRTAWSAHVPSYGMVCACAV